MGVQLVSPLADWRRWRGRGELRRGRATAAGGGTHGGLRFQQCEGNAVQGLAAQASVATREQASGVGRTGGRAGRRVHRRPAMADGGKGSGAREREGRGLNRCRPSGDIVVMREMLAVARRPRPARVRRGAAGGPPVRGARGPGVTPTVSGCGARGRVCLGRRWPWAARARTPRPAGARPWRGDARDVARGSAPSSNVLLVPCLSELFSKNLNKS
jgi:hypothetical protein